MKNSKNSLILIISLLGAVILFSLIFLLTAEEKLTEKNSVPVYFVKSIKNENFKISAVKRKISPKDSRITVAITELLKGPSLKEKNKGYYTEIPFTTKLIGVKELPKSIEINLSKDFESGGGSTSMIMRLNQVINTALDNSKSKPVYLEINGKKANAIGGEGIIVSQPLVRNSLGGREN